MFKYIIVKYINTRVARNRVHRYYFMTFTLFGENLYDNY